MDKNQMIVYKKEIAATTNTLGWRYICEIAERTVKELERQAIDEEDDLKGNTLRREAKAAGKFLKDFLLNVEVSRTVDVEATNDDGFMAY